MAGKKDNMMKFPSPQSRNNIITVQSGWERWKGSAVDMERKQFKKREITKEGTNKKKLS